MKEIKVDRRRFLKLCGWPVATLALPLPRSLAGKGRRRGNVLLILADDMGWLDSSTYGSRYYVFLDYYY